MTEIYTVSQENTPNIFDCNLKKDYQISIIFGTTIPDTTGHQMTPSISHLTQSLFLHYLAKQNKQNMRKNEQKTSINFISLDLCSQQPVNYKV